MFKIIKYIHSFPMTLNCVIDFNEHFFEKHTSHCILGRVQIVPSSLDDQPTQQPTQQPQTFGKHIVFVLDTSNSMAPNMCLLKSIMKKILESGHKQHIGIVTFNNETKVQPMVFLNNDQGNKELINTIDSLTHQGSTNLCQGLTEGLRTLWSDFIYSHPFSFNIPKERRQIVLLSDGIANCGVTSSSEILYEISETCPFLDQTDIYCLALGNYLNGDLLQTLAENYNGKLYLIENELDFCESFSDCMCSIYSTSFSNVQVTVQSCYHLNLISKGSQISETELYFNVGNMFQSDNRDLLFQIQVPENHIYESPIGMVTVEYTDTHSWKDHYVSKFILPTWSDPKITSSSSSSSSSSSPNVDVLTQLFRIYLYSLLQNFISNYDSNFNNPPKTYIKRLKTLLKNINDLINDAEEQKLNRSLEILKQMCVIINNTLNRIMNNNHQEKIEMYVRSASVQLGTQREKKLNSSNNSLHNSISALSLSSPQSFQNNTHGSLLKRQRTVL